MFLRVYDMPAPNESVAGRVCRAIAGLMIGGDWQEVNGWSRLPMSELQGKCSACEDDQKTCHVTNTSPSIVYFEVLLEIGRFEG